MARRPLGTRAMAERGSSSTPRAGHIKDARGRAVTQLEPVKLHRLHQHTIVPLDLRAFFIEDNATKFAQLKQYDAQIDDIEIELRNSKLEDSVDEKCEFIKSPETQTFPFIFIDPKG